MRLLAEHARFLGQREGTLLPVTQMQQELHVHIGSPCPQVPGGGC